MTIKNKTEKARRWLNQLRDYQLAQETVWWGVAEALANLKEDNLYKKCFGVAFKQEDNDTTWKNFLAQTDLLTKSGNRTTADYMVRMAQYYLNELNFKKKELTDYSHRKLDLLRRYELNKKQVKEMLPDCKSVDEGGLSISDLKTKLNQKYGNGKKENDQPK